METQIYLSLSFPEFEERVETFLAKVDSLIDARVTDEVQLIEFEGSIEEWNKNVMELLQQSFSKENNDYVHSFKQAQPIRYMIPNNGKPVQLPLHTIVKDKQDGLRHKKMQLHSIKKMVSISDMVLDPKDIILDQRKTYTTEEKLELILEKLYEVFDDYSYPIKEILEKNGVVLRRNHEERDLAKMLENRGLIDINGGGRDLQVRLTSEGAMFVEENRKPVKEHYYKINQTPEELKAKIDEIYDMLKMQGLGQEVIFEELQELKEQYTKLDKKNWGQLLKGKLLDIGMQKLLDTDVLKFIWEKLTDNQLTFPKL